MSAVPLARTPAKNTNEEVERFLNALWEPDGDPVHDADTLTLRHRFLVASVQTCDALVVACEQEVEDRKLALDLLEADSVLGEGNFGAPPDGANAAQREARRKKALFYDSQHLGLYETRRYWESRLAYVKALRQRLAADTRRIELLLGAALKN